MTVNILIGLIALLGAFGLWHLFNWLRASAIRTWAAANGYRIESIEWRTDEGPREISKHRSSKWQVLFHATLMKDGEKSSAWFLCGKGLNHLNDSGFWMEWDKREQ